MFSPPLLGNPAVLNTNNAVGKLGDLIVMSNHHNGLMEFLAGHFQKAQYIAAGSAVKVSVGSSARMIAGLETRARAIATRCC